MSTATRFRNHEKLMSRMASTHGVDLDLKMQMGDVTPDFYEDAVLNCAGCSDTDGCRKHVREGRPGLPSFCRNRDALQRLSGTSPTLD